MRKFKVLGYFVFIIILVIAPFVVRNEIKWVKQVARVKLKFPELLGKKLIFDLNSEMQLHPFANESRHMSGEPSFTLIKIVGIGCSSCYTSVQNWNAFLKSHENVNDLRVIFLAYGEERDAFVNSLKNESFPFDFIWDRDSSFIEINKLQHYGLQSFLLNKENIIIQVGDPLEDGYTSRAIKKLFK